MNANDQMKTLLEAVDSGEKAPKVDEPKTDYKNRPNEQTVDASVQQDAGDDLNGKKQAQFRSRTGDNAMAMTPVKVKDVQESLEKKWEEYKKTL